MFAKCLVMQIVEYKKNKMFLTYKISVWILGALFIYFDIYKFVHFSMILIKSFL